MSRQLDESLNILRQFYSSLNVRAVVFDNVSVEITRPANTTAYTAGALINAATNSTTLPALDFTACGATAGQKIQIHSISVTSSYGGATTKLLPWVSLYNANAITGQNLGDAQAFNPTYAEVVAKRAKSFRDDEFTVASISTNAYLMAINEIARELTLDASKKLYVALKAMNAYTPASGEKFTIAVSGFLL